MNKYDSDTLYQPNITCPYCGHIDRDSWEFDGDDEEVDLIECDCGKDYYATRNIDITYSTWKNED